MFKVIIGTEIPRVRKAFPSILKRNRKKYTALFKKHLFNLKALTPVECIAQVIRKITAYVTGSCSPLIQ